MVIVDLTYKNRNIENQVNKLVGRPYSFWERIKMRGIGSNRLNIIEASDEIANLLNRTNTTARTNIELRPEGIIIGIASGYQNFAWVIPFTALKIHRYPKQLSVYAGDYFVLLEAPVGSCIDKGFLSKLLEAVDLCK